MMKNKRGMSEIVGYVLLIVIALALAGLVFGFLRGFVPKDTETCPPDLSIAIISARCDNSSGTPNPALINITFQNKGLFNVNGFYLRGAGDVKKPAMVALKSVDGIFTGKFYFKLNEQLNQEEKKGLMPGEKENFIVQSSDDGERTEIKKIELEPFINGKRGIVLCEEAITSVETTC